MASRISAGLLMFRIKTGQLEIFLAHPGGPYFVRKDKGHWTIPKGEIDAGEDYLEAAIREFKEEIGIEVDRNGDFIPLGSIRQKGGKTVHAWGVAGDRDESLPIQSNTFECEWPPRSGTFKTFPEVDQARFFGLDEARERINPAQIPLIDELEKAMSGST